MTFDTHNLPNSSGGASSNTHCPLPGPVTQSTHFQISLPSTCSPTGHHPLHLKTSQHIRIPEPRLYNKRHHQHQLRDHAIPQYYIPLALHRRRPPTHKILENSRLPFPHRLKYDNTMMLRPCLPLHTYDQRRHSTSPTTTTTTTSFTIPISLTLRRSPPPRSPLHSHPSRTWTGRKSVSSSGTSLLNTDIDTNTTLPRVLIPTLPLCSSNVESYGSDPDPDSSLQLPPIQNEIIRRGSSDLSASLQSYFWNGAGSCSGGSQPQCVETGVGEEEEGREIESEGLTQTQMQRGQSGSDSSAMSY